MSLPADDDPSKLPIELLAQRLEGIRLCPHIYNSSEEIDPGGGGRQGVGWLNERPGLGLADAALPQITSEAVPFDPKTTLTSHCRNPRASGDLADVAVACVGDVEIAGCIQGQGQGRRAD